MNGRRHLDDLDADIREHLERETQDHIDRGMAPEDARAAALRKFGSVVLAKEDTRAVWIPVWLDQVMQDVRYALRMLRRSPGFSGIVMLTLAIGIGMNTAVFSVVNAVLVRPLSYPHPERVLWLATLDGRVKDEFVTAMDFLAWRDATSFEHLVAYGEFDDRVVTGDRVVPARIAMVSDDFWALAGARPVVGRMPGPGEAAALVSQAFFERWFNADPGIVGKAVAIDGRQTILAGVLPPGFHVQLPPPSSWDALEPRAIDVYRVLVVRPPVNGRVELFRVLGALKPGVSIATARAELETFRARVANENPSWPIRKILRVVPLSEKLVGEARTALLILLAAVVLVLLVACANIANLLLARGSTRQKEIAIRAAVGAGRGRVLRQFLVESLLLAAIGGGAGLLLARASLKVMLRLIPQAVPRLAETTIDGQVLAFALVMSVVTALLFGVGPALALWNTNTYDVLKDGRQASATPGSLRVRSLLVVAELALTAVLLCGAGLLVKSVWRMNTHPAGFDPAHTLTMKVLFDGPQFDAIRRRAYIDEALRRVRGVPGVEAVGMTTNAGSRTRLSIEGAQPVPGVEPPVVLVSEVSAGYAKAIGMRLVAGRWFTDAEPAQVFVINETLARREFAGQDPIGRRMQNGGRRGAPDASFAPIVGVVADLKYTKLDSIFEPEIFTDYGHTSPFIANFVVRTAGDPLLLAPAIRALVADVDTSQTVDYVKTLDQVLTDSIAPRRFNVFLFGTFAAAALLVALVGIYGVIAYSVAQRTHEIGVRIALGAERRTVVRMIVQQGMGIALAGLVLGLAAAVALTRVMTSLLYEVTPTDPATFGVVIGVLAATALAACCGPALRAARVDPLVALRCE